MTIDTIREAHEPESVYFDSGDFSHRECRMCRQRWTDDQPCDATIVLADADRLAEALREHISTYYTIEDSGYTYLTYTGSPTIGQLRKALRQHTGGEPDD